MQCFSQTSSSSAVPASATSAGMMEFTLSTKLTASFQIELAHLTSSRHPIPNVLTVVPAHQLLTFAPHCVDWETSRGREEKLWQSEQILTLRLAITGIKYLCLQGSKRILLRELARLPGSHYIDTGCALFRICHFKRTCHQDGRKSTRLRDS